MVIEGKLRKVAELLTSAESILFITGAGISADSGLPTYRGTGGLYNGEITEEGMSIEHALSADVFDAKPEITWKYLAQIEHLCRGAEPNAAHLAIAQLERMGKYVMVFTQNIDGLHRRAGSSELIEIHGNLQNLRCTGCDFAGKSTLLIDSLIPPCCPSCGSVLKPTVVLFGEMLPEGELDRLYTEMEQGFDVVATIGTSSVFPYISMPVIWALRNQIPTVEINPSASKLSEVVDYHLDIGAADAFTQIMGMIDEVA